MKKFLSMVTSLLLLTPIVFTAACSFSFLGIDLNKLPDYDWNSEEPYFNGYQQVPNIKGINSSGDVSYLKNQRYIDYANFNTGFKNLKGIKKQAVTGVALNSAFLPNGNYLKDFGEKNKSLMFQKVNSILDWNPAIDHDAKYNQSDYPLLKTKKVASKWVNSQDSSVKSLIMGLAVKSTSGTNSIVGTNRIFAYNFNNWQYADRYGAWAGAADEGIIVPPAADAVDAAHINGTKIYGQIFLDGYHGLTKSMLKDFLQKDKNGNYKIVNILINMAKYMGFDGWFYNNEPNGAFLNGFIMDSQNSINILNQFRQIVKNNSDPEIHNLEMISYKNQGTLDYLNNNQPVDQLASDLANSTNGIFLQDFYTYPNQSWKWSQNHQQYNSFDINNLYNLGGWVNSKIFYNEKRIGTRNIKELSQRHLDPNGQPYSDPNQEISDMNANKWTFDNKNVNSLAIFAASTPIDLATMYLNKLGHPPTMQDDLFATMYSNYYDDMVYTGHNRALSNNDKGSVSWNPNYNVNELSYGIGDIKLENTILFDNLLAENNVRFFKSNFSTGQGQFFVQNNGNKIINYSYPWNNRRLVDSQPTYKWDIRNSSNQTNNSDITGYYDYYDAYAKGNAIALGKAGNNNSLGFDNKGQIKPTLFKNAVDWNIMGTNYLNDNKQVDFIYKITDDKGDWSSTTSSKFNVNLIVTLDNGSVIPVSGSIVPKANGWIALDTKLNGIIVSNAKIAKIGLRISPNVAGKTTAIKFDVGQLTINNINDNPPSIKESNPTYITNLNSEYAIERNNYYSLRLNWTPNIILRKQIAYYEIYLQKDNGECWFLGATANNNYYVKNLLLNRGDRIIIKTINKYYEIDSKYQAWNLI